MESAINNGMCRCCASEGTFKDLKSAYQWMGDEEVYSEMLRECFDITLFTNIEGEVEGGICEVCVTQLRNASNFKKQVLQTEEQFKLRLQDKLFKNDIVKVEAQPDSDNDSDNDHASEDYSEYEVPIKLESDEPKPKKRGAKASTSRAKRTKTDDGETSKREPRRYRPKKVSKAALRRIRSAAMKTVREQKNNLLKIMLHSNANPIKGTDLLEGIQCLFCPETIKSSPLLKEHFVEKHRDEEFLTSKMKIFSKNVWKLDITNLRCDICATAIDTIPEMLIHFKSVHGMEVTTGLKDIFLPFRFDTDELRCAICTMDYPVFKLLREHMNVHFRNYICDECDAGYVTHELLYRHKLRHIVKETSCSYCKKTFTSKDRAHRHVQLVHWKIKKYKCNYCTERFEEFNSKLRHMKKAHNKNLELSCPVCDRTFITPQAVRLHLNRYHMMMGKTHLCAECGTSFYTRALLKNHERKHSGLKNFTCDECPKSFVSKQALKAHLKCHGGTILCLFCSKTFPNDIVLRVHVETIHANLFDI
ncbi:zinc finger protein 668-like isoform X3 [Pectinophora gossypiella]|uniref:zinc finger protein 668-like isoform X3 n=1 Tax=Pectinophora gossypiella TaxID=13191 RepID=UPI00214E1FD5|nr:zinc finger protein 668-like isoform X3 [Pectinophora gossypiella]